MRKFRVRWWHSEQWLDERWEQVRCSLRPDAEEARLGRLIERLLAATARAPNNRLS